MLPGDDARTRFVRSWLSAARLLILSFVIAAISVKAAEAAGLIYTTGIHTAWVTTVLFLSAIAIRDVRRR